MTDETDKRSLSYKDAGVDIEAGDRLVDMIRPLAASTRRAGADSDLGGFGGAFDLKAAGYRDPVLISGTDGVGTKLKIAVACEKYDGLGVDLVAMCVNDVLVQGAEPLFFLDYFATGALHPERAASIIAGVAAGCREAGCALIGGETAEMPGLYEGLDFDLAGFVVGAAERGHILPNTSEMTPGDVLIGLASSGAHSNGYSLFRRIVEREGLEWSSAAPFNSDSTLADIALAPTRIYVKSVLPLLREGLVKGAAHITGGGVTENTPRMLPKSLRPVIDYSSWPRPELFRWLQETGHVEETEMRRTFNLGLGMILCVAEDKAKTVMDRLDDCGEAAWIVGRLGKA